MEGGASSNVGWSLDLERMRNHAYALKRKRICWRDETLGTFPPEFKRGLAVEQAQVRIKLVAKLIGRAKTQLQEPRMQICQRFGIETQYQTLREHPGCLNRLGVEQNGMLTIGELLEAIDDLLLAIGLSSIKRVAVKGDMRRQHADS